MATRHREQETNVPAGDMSLIRPHRTGTRSPTDRAPLAAPGTQWLNSVGLWRYRHCRAGAGGLRIDTMTISQRVTLPSLPSDSLSMEVLDFLRRSVSAPIANHSIRAFLWAELLVDHWDVRQRDDYDREALFFATILHDLGLGPAGDEPPDRFEVAGADIAARFLEENGVDRTTVDSVWEAIALHTSIGIASRRALLCQLTAAGTALDFGDGSDFVSDELGASIHAEYPRLNTSSALHNAIVTQARNNPAKAPLASLARFLLVTESAGIDPQIPARWGD